MSFFISRLRVSLLALWICSLAGSLALAADPKVVRTSHQTPAKTAVADPEESLEDDLSYSPQWPEPPDTGAILFRLFGGTVVVLGLCAATLWIGKPYLMKLQAPRVSGSTMTVEGSVAVGRAMLYLVRVGGTQLIAGTDAGGLKSLMALPPTFKEVLDEHVEDSDTSPADSEVSTPINAPLAFGIRSAPRSAGKD